MGIVEGPAVSGSFGSDGGGDNSGPSVQPGDTVRIVAPGEPYDGVAGVVLDVVAVQTPGALMPYVVARGNVEKV